MTGNKLTKIKKLRDLWDAHTSGSTPFPYATGRHHSSSPALRENLFLSVVLVVFLNFNWLILFPRTLILLLVKVLFFCHYRSRQFFIKMAESTEPVLQIDDEEAERLLDLPCQVSLRMSDILSILSMRKMIAFPSRKRKRVTKKEASIRGSDYSSHWVEWDERTKQENSGISQSEYRRIASW